MLYTNTKDINIPFLHDAAVVLSKRYCLKGIYLDHEGGIALYFDGKLPLSSIKDVLQNINPNDVSTDELHPEFHIDYTYSDGYTNVFSPDDIDYRML